VRLAGAVSVVRERRGVQAVLHTLAANVLIQAINAGTGILTARVLLAQGRGELAAIILWPQFLAYMLTLGTPVSLVYQIKRHPEVQGALTAAALAVGMAMGLLATGIGIVGIPIWLHQYSAADIRQAQILMVLAPASLISVVLIAAIQAREAFGVYNLFRYLPPILILLSLAVLALVDRLTVAAAAWAYMLAGLPVFVWSLCWVWLHLRPTLDGARAALRPLVHYGLRAWGSDLLGTIGGQLDRLLVVGLLAPADMGLYVVAQSLAGLLALLPNAIVPVLLPRAAGRPVPAALESVRQAAVLALGAMLAAAVPLFFFGGLLLRVVYGAEFGAATAVFQLLLLQGVLAGVASVLTQVFLATGRPGTVSLLQALALVTAAPLLVFLIPGLGLVGAGVALVCSTAVQLLAVVILYVRLRRIAVGTGTLGPHGAAS
jgi:O-antigen/teichoic acid export membrane protein